MRYEGQLETGRPHLSYPSPQKSRLQSSSTSPAPGKCSPLVQFQFQHPRTFPCTASFLGSAKPGERARSRTFPGSWRCGLPSPQGMTSKPSQFRHRANLVKMEGEGSSERICKDRELGKKGTKQYFCWLRPWVHDLRVPASNSC